MPVPDPQAYFSKAGDDGASVRSHLTELIQKMLSSKSDDVLAKLESLSLDVKASHFAATGPKPSRAIPAGSTATIETFKGAAAVVPNEAFHKNAKALLTAAAPAAPATADLPELLPMFSHAGVGLSKEETFRVYLAMKKLAADKSLTGVRFLGKILGTKSDYVIIEGSVAAEGHIAPSNPGPTPAEPPGVGLNTYVYFVAPSATDEFVQLEDVTPEQVLASMKIRKYFTGALAAPVACYPAFPGPESAYLRAQIARMQQATLVVPAGKLEFDPEFEGEGPKPMKAVEGYAPPADPLAPDAWVQMYGGLLKIGRTTNVPKPEPVDGEEPAEEEPEEEVEALAPIAEDGWSSILYNGAYDAYAVAIAKSKAWPGAYAAISKTGDKAACVYFGYGQESLPGAFTPVAPPPIKGESAEEADEEEVGVAAENALLKQIDEEKLIAANGEGEAVEAE